MQDLLAMAALQLATKKDKNTSSDQKEFNLDIDDIESKLKSISEDLDKLN